MEVEEVLNLFDSLWFEHGILMPKHEDLALEAVSVHQRTDQETAESTVQEAPNLRIRSLSDRYLGRSITKCFREEEASPTSVIIKPKKLQKILSGKEINDFVTGQETPSKKLRESRRFSRRERGRKGMKRSLSALEFEEVKGFMDLGFVFDEEAEKDTSLVSIIPGLQKLRKMASDDEEQVISYKEKSSGHVSRPYLSEAWGVSSERKGHKKSTKWKIPYAQNEIKMKDHLRVWAHNVASTVR